MIDRQEARSDVARIDPAADRWLHTANRARATTDPATETAKETVQTAEPVETAPKAKKGCPSALGSLKEISEIVADTADFNALPADAVDATTNPTLISKIAATAAGDGEGLIEEALKKAKEDVPKGESPLNFAMHYLSALVATKIQAKIPKYVSLEINPRHSFDQASMLKDVKDLLAVCKKANADLERVVVKIPATWDGIQVCKVVSAEGVKVNMTLVFSVIQAIACVDAGAFLISPFVGRVTDYYKKEGVVIDNIDADPGVVLVRDIYATIKKTRPEASTIVMAASFRTVDQILAVAGCTKITISPTLINELSDMQAKTLKDENDKLPIEKSDPTVDTFDPVTYSTFNFEMSRLLMPQVLTSDGVRKFDESWRQTVEFLQSKL